MGLQISSSVTITPQDLIIAEYIAVFWIAYISYNYFTSAYKYHLTEEKGKARRLQRDQKIFLFPQVS